MEHQLVVVLGGPCGDFLPEKIVGEQQKNILKPIRFYLVATVELCEESKNRGQNTTGS